MERTRGSGERERERARGREREREARGVIAAVRVQDREELRRVKKCVENTG